MCLVVCSDLVNGDQIHVSCTIFQVVFDDSRLQHEHILRLRAYGELGLEASWHKRVSVSW